MLYKEISTEVHYKAAIQKFWILDNSFTQLHSPTQYALPNGCCTIAFISGNGLSLNFNGRNFDLSPGVYLSGQITKRTGISLKPHTKAVMAQLKPWVPTTITKIPMSELVDRTLHIDDINCNFFRPFKDIDLANETALINTFYKILNSFTGHYDNSYFIQWIFGRLQTGSFDKSNIADLAKASGYTQRRVEQKFNTLVGPTVKTMQRILQLRGLIDELQYLKNYGNLGKLAVRHGYYDQSHFIRSYQHIISETPIQFNSDDYILPVAGHFGFLQS